jgi:cyanophycinase
LLSAVIVAQSRGADAAPTPLDPRGLPGPLVLTGGKSLPKDVAKAFFDLAGKEKAKIVVIPTANANATEAKALEAFVQQWKDMKAGSVIVLHTTDAKQANSEGFAKPLADATGVWFVHGNADRVLNAYRGTAVERELKKLHARGGTIGCAVPGILGDKCLDADAKKLVPSFGFVSGYIFDSNDKLATTVAANPGTVGVRIPDGAGVFIRGRVARVIGDEAVEVYVGKGAGKPAANDDYNTGALLDLLQLQRAAFNRAAKEPFPPAKVAEPNVAKGSLVIVGGGGAGEEIWKRFIQLAGGPDSQIVVVTTAMEDPLAPESVEEKVLKKYGAKNVVALHTRDRKEADNPKFSEVLLKAKGVWFSGGRQWRFVDSYEGTLTQKRFREVLDRGGVIGGSSAGASIQSEFMPRGHPLGNTVMAAEGYERGFGYLPGCAVDQHFFARKRTGDMTGLMKQYPQYLGIGLDEGTAIVVTGTTAEVIGRTKVAFYDTTRKIPDGEKDYEEVVAGEKYDLKLRKKK